MTLARSTPSKAQFLIAFVQNRMFLPIKGLTCHRPRGHMYQFVPLGYSYQSASSREAATMPVLITLAASNKLSSQHIREARETSLTAHIRWWAEDGFSRNTC